MCHANSEGLSGVKGGEGERDGRTLTLSVLVLQELNLMCDGEKSRVYV